MIVRQLRLVPRMKIQPLPHELPDGLALAYMVVHDDGSDHVVVRMPDPHVAWIVRIRLETTDQRVAYYPALAEPDTG